MEDRRRVVSSFLTTVSLLLLFLASYPLDFSFWDYLVLALLLIAIGNLLYELLRLKRAGKYRGNLTLRVKLGKKPD